jgi:G protein beta subunit-like protein
MAAIMMPVVLATGGFDHKIRLWEATTGTCPKLFRFADSQVNCLSISSDKTRLLAGGNPMISMFDLMGSSDSPSQKYEGHTNNVTSLGFQRDGKWFYSASEDGTVSIWDTRSPTRQRTYDCNSAVNSVTLNPNQVELITGDQSGTIRVWDLTMNACRCEHTPMPDCPIRSVSIACNASIMCAGSHKGRMYVYDTRDGKLELERDFQVFFQ